MKKIILWSLCFLTITALIPFCVGIKRDKPVLNKEKAKFVSANAVNISALTEEDKDSICCISMEYIDKNANKELKLAILSLCANNYLYTKNTENIMPEPEISTYSDSLMQELKELVNEGLIELFYKKKVVYIPITDVSAGYIATSDEYPYIEPIASPWDKFSEKYPPDNPDKCGISIEGIKYLCNAYGNPTEALKWYLPDFEIIYAEST